MAGGYNNSSQNGIYRRRSEVYWRRRKRKGLLRTLDAGVPIEVNIDPVDITVQPVAVELDKIVDPNPVDITVQPVALDNAKIIDVDPVDVTVQPVAVDPAKIFDVTSTVDITVQPVATSDNTKIIDVPVVDITVVPVTPTRQKRIDIDPVDTTVQPATITYARAVAIPPVNIALTSMAVDVAKLIDPSPVDITVQTVAPDLARYVDLDSVPITVTPVEITHGSVVDVPVRDVTVQPVAPTVYIRAIMRPTPVDVTVQPVTPKVAKIIDIDPVDITVSAETVYRGTGVAVPPVDIHVELLDPVIGSLTGYVDITVEVLPVRAGRIFDIEPVDIDVDVNFNASTAKIIDVPPVNITVQPVAVKHGKGYAAAYVDIHTEPLPIDGVKVWTFDSMTQVNPITVQPVAVDPAKIIDVPPVNITVVTPRVSANTFKSKPTEVTVQPVAVKVAKIIDVPVVNITRTLPTPDLAKIIDVPVVNITAQPIPGILAYSSDMDPVEIEVQVLPVEIVYGASKTRAFYEVRQPPKISPVRVLAQNILSGEWLHTDLPLSNLEIEKTLSGPQQITGNFPTEIRDLFDAGLEPWGTWIHVEENNEIRASGILQPTTVDKGQALSLRAVGVSAYPDGIPYLGPDYSRVSIDAADIVRYLWAHIQGYPDGNLNVVVRGTTGYLVGSSEPAETIEFVTGTGENVNFESGGPYKLVWWEATDCGSEIGKLASEAPFDYVERERWHDPIKKDYVEHFIDIGWPRAGRKKPELRFTQDENLKEAVGPGETEGTYASQVVLLGKGEGSSKIRGYAGQNIGTRVRRVKVIDDKTVDNTTRANALSREDIARRQAIYDITDFIAKAYHDNARIGSYDVGDDVMLSANVPWLGRVDQWERITSFRYQPGSTEDVYVTCRRSESFEYGRTS